MDQPYKFSDAHHRARRVLQEPWVRDLYDLWLPNIKSLHRYDGDTPEDKQHQTRGIDVSLVLDTGAIVFVEEKVDFYTTGNFFLETWGNVEEQREGWITKPQWSHYIMYIFPNWRTGYVFATQQLQRTWRLWGERWQARYRTVPVHNGWGGHDYNSVGVCVPIEVVRTAYGASGYIKVPEAPESHSKTREQGYEG